MNPSIKLQIILKENYSTGILIEILTNSNINFKMTTPHEFIFLDEKFIANDIHTKIRSRFNQCEKNEIEIKQGYSGLIQSIVLYATLL